MDKYSVGANEHTLNSNREFTRKLLDRSLKVHGLKKETNIPATTLLTLHAEKNTKSIIKRFVRKAEELGAFRISAKARVLPIVPLEMNDVDERILQEISDDCIDVFLKVKCAAANIEKFELDSLRVLISEIYIRLGESTCRKDNKSPSNITWRLIAHSVPYSHKGTLRLKHQLIRNNKGIIRKQIKVKSRIYNSNFYLY